MARTSLVGSNAWVLAPLLVLGALTASCTSAPTGPTAEFEQRVTRQVFVLAPPTGRISGEQAELVRRVLMADLRERGYAVSSSADARFSPVVEDWGKQVTLTARLLDGKRRVLWEDRGMATSSKPRRGEQRTPPEDLVATAVRKLLRSLPAPPPR